MRQLPIIMLFLFLFSCNKEKKKTTNTESLIGKDSVSTVVQLKNELPAIDTIDFEMVSGDKLKLFKLLDSSEMVKWTDKFMPKGLVELKLYSAHLINERELNKNIQIKTLITYADDWTRMHLITCSFDSTLIDFKEIGENMSYLIEQTDSFELYMENDSKLIVLNDSTFKLEQIEITTKDFYDESTKDSVMTFETDSIFIVDRNGKINNRL
jgi:hypothetical protein